MGFVVLLTSLYAFFKSLQNVNNSPVPNAVDNAL